MFEKIAVVGTGVIGTIAGGFLTLAGHDVTIVPAFRRHAAEILRRDGITIQYEGETFRTPVKAVFIDDIPAGERFDLVLITGKSNDTEVMTRKMLPHMGPDSVISSLQNGINEDVIIPLAGRERVVPCVCFTGGFSAGPGQVENHPGFLVVGELDGAETPRVRELAKVLSDIKPTEISPDIMRRRWEKLAEISMGVPLACASGYHQFCGNDDKRMQRLFARIACESFGVARACGYELERISMLTEPEARLLASKDVPELGDRLAHHPMAKDEPPEGATGLAALVDAYTADIRKGAPLEIGYANGYIVKKGKELGVPVPAQEAVVNMVFEIQRGERKADKNNLDELIAMTDPFYC